jgi:hypothetical protein
LDVIGVRKNYSVTFSKALNIISGEMSTGKTTILKLIDYCFGGSSEPSYPEFLRNARTALLECSVGEETFTLQRHLFEKEHRAVIHFCAISDLASDHKSIEVSSYQRVNEESISSFMLSKIGLSRIPLKEAPTKDASGVDYLSFRDVLWVCYLERTRVAGADLLFENTIPKMLKLRQVVDIIFGVHSDRLAILARDLSETEAEISEREQSEKTLEAFAISQAIPTIEDIDKEKAKLREETTSKKQTLDEIGRRISGSSEIAQDIRNEVLNLRKKLQEIRSRKWDDEQTLRKVIPLRGQYHEDIMKLNFLTEAKRVINPLSLVVCPVCLSPLDTPSNKELCPCCGKPLPLPEADVSIDVSREIRTINRKLGELETYVSELEQRIAHSEREDKTVSLQLKSAGERLDETLRSFLSPYQSQRDELIAAITSNDISVHHLEDWAEIRKNIQSVTEDKIRLRAKQEQIQAQIEEERTKSVTRHDIISSLSNVFLDHLETVKFPKLDENANIDDKLVPFVRGSKYDELSSEGAIDLASICWMTSIFELAMLGQTHHPGFLILDSIQSGIGVGATQDQDFRDVGIVNGLYTLLKRVSELDPNCQLIVVDNHPPTAMHEYQIVYYSGNAKKPPYGFIDNETS